MLQCLGRTGIFELLIAKPGNRDQSMLPFIFLILFLVVPQTSSDVLSNLKGFHIILLPFLSLLSKILIIFNHSQRFNYCSFKADSQILIFSPNILSQLRLMDLIAHSPPLLVTPNLTQAQTEVIINRSLDLPISQVCQSVSHWL